MSPVEFEAFTIHAAFTEDGPKSLEWIESRIQSAITRALAAQAEQIAALKDCKCEGTNSPACGECLECYRRTAENLLHLSNQHHAEIEALNGMLSNEAAKLRLAGRSCDELREQIAALRKQMVEKDDSYNTLRNQLDAKDAEIERLNAAVESVCKGSFGASEALAKDNADLRTQLAAAKEELAACQTNRRNAYLSEHEARKAAEQALNTANAAAGERLEALKKIHAILQQRDNSYFHDMVEEWLEDYAQPVMRNDCGTSLLRELEQLRAELKSQYERDWTASIIDRLNEFARENAGQFSEIDTGQQAAAMVRDMHGCYNSLRHLNTDLRQSLDQLRQEQDELLKDKERLDWLEANPPQVQITWVNVHSGRRWTADNCADHKSYETLRAAIDAALHPTSKEQP